MEIKFQKIVGILISITFISCASNPGTEITNPPVPLETPKKDVDFDILNYEVVLQVPETWIYSVYGENTSPGTEAFTDSDSETLVEATFIKKDKAFLTVFSSALEKEETLEDYVRIRRPQGNLETRSIAGEEGQVSTAIYFYQENPGPHDGFVFDIYLEYEGVILWMRTELAGSDEERAISWDEFKEIINSIQIIEKGKRS